MFNYFGSKSKFVSRYPEPKYDLIIEPFAGSAQYAFKYWDHPIILMEKDKRTFDVWKWLQVIDEGEILKLPDYAPGAKIDYHIPEARLLILWSLNPGQLRRNRTTAGHFTGAHSAWPKKKLKIAEGLKKIRHWDIKQGSFESLENQEAVWFIDPPYQNFKGYLHNLEDYSFLANWCKSRLGQTVVCEMDGADWLPFTPFYKASGLTGHTKEVIWTT